MVTAALSCFLVALALDRGKALRLAASIAVPATVAVLLLTYQTDGEFLRHTVQYNVNPFSFRRLLREWRTNLTGKAGITTLAAAFFAYLAVTLRHKSGRTQIQNRGQGSTFWLTGAIWGVYFLFSLLLTVTGGKQGSAFNYFLEWNAVCAVLGGLAFLLLLQEIAIPRMSFSLLLAFTFPLVCVSESIVTYKTPLGWLREVPDAAHSEWLAGEQKVLDFITQAKGPVFSDALLLLLKGGKEIEGEPAIMTGLADAGLWNQAAFVAKIRRGYFDRVVAENFVHPFFTPEVSKAIEETYPRVQRVGGYQLFEKP
jgi:hypothetical protein